MENQKNSEQYCSELAMHLQNAIDQVKQEEYENKMQYYEKIIALSQNHYNQLRNFIKDYQFENETEEIKFFKVIKPQLMMGILYYQKILQWEIALQSCASSESKQKYLYKQLNTIEKHSQSQGEFRSYFLMGKSHFDQLYFKRSTAAQAYNNCQEIGSFENDPQFSTGRDMQIALLKADEKGRDYLLNKMKQINECQENNQKYRSTIPLIPLHWTSNGFNLIELAYALLASGVFNFGKIKVSDLFELIGMSIHSCPKLKNHSRSFHQIKNRKQKTLFLDQLKKDLLRYMENPDFRMEEKQKQKKEPYQKDAVKKTPKQEENLFFKLDKEKTAK